MDRHLDDRFPFHPIHTTQGAFMRLSVLAVLALAPVFAAAQSLPQDRVTHVRNDDSEMNRAIAQAQASLDDFLALARNPPSGADTFKLKVKFSDPNGDEHMWVIPFQQNAKDFSGVLANAPETVRNVQLGQTVHFKRADITDWGYRRDGKQYGSFTVCVLFKHMPPDEVAAFRSYGFQCDQAPARTAKPVRGAR
jgi:uncharacterized protein YegJ (DUF2314 family)